MFCKTVVSKVFDFIDEHALVEENDTILVALSAGPDSVFLATVLSQYNNKDNAKLSCCHVNHGLRGTSSARDEQFARAFAREHGLSMVVKQIDVVSHSRKHGLSLEEAARDLRMKALEEAREEMGAKKVALGHTADDSIETFLFNLLRGTGRKGLSGIQPKRNNVIRPLLGIERREIIRFLKENRIDYRIDVTNWQCGFSRNFIRHRLLPHIEKELKRNVKSNILQLIDIIKSEEELLAHLTSELFVKICAVTYGGIVLGRGGFRDADTGLQRRLIVRCFGEVADPGFGLNFKEIESIRRTAAGKTSGETFMYHGVRFLIGAGSILVTRKDPPTVEKGIEVTLKTADDVAFCDRYRIRTTVIDKVNGDLENPDCAYFDLEKLALPITLRTRQSGDTFVPFGMEQGKKVKDFLIDEKVDFWKRDTIPIIADAKAIIWIAGIRRGAAAKVDKHTKRILKIEKRDLG